MTLALIALGESHVTDDDEQHLASCAHCRAEVEQLAAVVATGRSVTVDDYPATPSVAVWDRIVAEVGDDAGQRGDSNPEVASLDDRRAGRRRPRWALSLAAAAAVGLVVGIGGTWSVTRSTTPTPTASPSGSTTPTPTASPSQVSVAVLKPVDEPAAKGTAVLSVASAGQRTITVSVANLPTHAGTFYEVWLMDPTDSKLVALGVLGTGGHGDYVVPAGLDLTLYSAVDVSLQPMNGSPQHSSNSAVRGSIAT
jgi:anti-sigma-K factor RskA